MSRTYNPQQLAEQASGVMHASDNCAKTLGIEIIAVKPGSAIAVMTPHQDYANGHGYCQGGIITTLADTAFAHACNSYNVLTVAQGLSIEFVRSAKIGDELTATAEQLSRGKNTGVYQIIVTDPQQKTVAIMMGKSFARAETVFNTNEIEN